jgi:biopolymer transport protein ExbD
MPLKTHQDDVPTLNLTSMIDVTFLLVIFFMVGTKFADMERDISIQVPQVTDNGALTPAPEKRVVNVYRDGRLSLDREFVTLEELQARLAEARAEYEGLGVIVRGDAEGPFQNVASALNACRQAGIAEMGISVRLAREEVRTR